MSDVAVRDPQGKLVEFNLAQDKNGQLIYTEHTLDLFKPGVQIGEATYASFDPQTQGVFAQDDLSGGVGKKLQVPMSHADFKRVRYGNGVDFGSYGIMPGPALTAITKLANGGSLTGAFELGGYLYLVCGRIIAKYDHAAGTISEAEDLGAGVTGYAGATWIQTGAEAKDQENTGDTNTDDMANAFTLIAQKVVPAVSGYLSRVDLKLIRAGTVTGNVTVGIQMDYDGQPSGVDVSSTLKVAANVSTSATLYTFRFESDDLFYQVKGEPFWIVIAAPAATAGNTIGWRRDNTNPGGYGAGTGAISADGGDSYTLNTNSTDYYFATYAKAATATSFVGKAQGAKFLTTTDGATFTADSVYEGKHFCVYQDLLVRDCRETSAGAISWTSDGKNWSEPVLVGDPTVQITGLLVLPNCVLVLKEDSIWAVDPYGTPAVSVDVIFWGGKSTTNGVGAYVWTNTQTAYIPFDGAVVTITGDFTSGFTVNPSVGPAALDEWETPWGAGRIVALAGDRHCLYAALSTSTSYKLLKSYDPDGKRWIGAIADLGTPTTLTFMRVFDRGATNSPLLFASGDSDNLTKIILPRTANPWADASYQVNTSAGSLYYSTATGNMPATPKAWLFETVTFTATASGGYAELLWDDGNGDGWRVLDARLYRTGMMPYPAGLGSLLLDRQLLIKAGSATAYPVILVSGLTYTVRPSYELKQYQFTVEADRTQSGAKLGQLLGVDHRRARALMDGLPVTGGTRTLIDPDREEHEVIFRYVNRTIVERATEGHSYFEVVAVSKGV